MTRSKLIIVSAVAALGIALVGGWLWWQSDKDQFSQSADMQLIIDDQHTFKIRIADTPDKQQLGLAGTSSLAEDEGMYFPLDPAISHSFWMKDMLIPIDIIWINKGRIVGIEREVQPPRDTEYDNDLPIYSQPTSTVDGVLEIASGRSRELNIEVGQSAVLVMSHVRMVDR